MSTHPQLHLVALSVAVAASAALFAGCSATPSAPSSSSPSADNGTADTVTIVDEQDREVELPADPDSAVVINSYNVELFVALGLRDAIVGIDDRSLFRAPYGNFTEDDVVGVDFQSLDYERIATLDPDVVFIPRNGVWEDAVDQLAAFDIPVVVLSVWDPTIWNDNVELIADIFGAQERATEITEFTDSVNDLVAEKTAGLTPVDVYYEDSAAFDSAGASSGKTAALEAAAGNNIFGDVTTGGGLVIQVDPVDVIAANPAVVLRENISQFPPVEQTTLTDTLTELLSREGWSDIDAVRNNRVIVYNAGPLDAAGRTFSSLYFGSWLHPDAFADVDPDAYVQEWAQTFLGTDFDPSTGYVAVSGE